MTSSQLDKILFSYFPVTSLIENLNSKLQIYQNSDYNEIHKVLNWVHPGSLEPSGTPRYPGS
jgi:hypothetical protein